MLLIRSTAAELEQVSLEDGLAICLAFLDLEPETSVPSRWSSHSSRSQPWRCLPARAHGPARRR
jgi:hypothetical protein